MNSGLAERTLKTVAWLLVAALTTSLAIFRISSYDVWWHLKTGEYILAHHSIPLHDMFSFAAQGRRWITHEWLFEVMLFLAYRVGHLAGLTLLKALIVLLALLVTFLTLHRLRIDVLLALPLVVVVAFLVTSRAFERPDVVTELFCALYVMVLLSYKYSPQRRAARNRLWLLLPVQLLWANIHSGMVLGLGIVALFIVGESLQHRFSQRLASPQTDTLMHNESSRGVAPGIPPRLLFGLFVGLAAVSFLNPNLQKALLYPLTIAGNPNFSRTINELQSPLNPMFWSSDFFIAFLVFLVSGIISFVTAGKRLDLSNLLLFGTGAVMALLAVRNLPVFALVGAPIVALNLSQTNSARLPPIAHRRRRLFALCACILVPGALLVMVFTRGVEVGGGLRKPGIGIDETTFPIKAADFLDRNSIQGNVFNSLEYGGYLIWRGYPQRQVFIDGRLDVYGSDLFGLYVRALRSGPQFDSLVGVFNISCCFLAQPVGEDSLTRGYLGRTLGLRPDWSLVFWDDQTLIYLRNVEANRATIEQNAYRAIVPFVLGIPTPTNSNPQLALDEALRASRASPGAATMTVLGFVYLSLNRTAEARQAYEKALAFDPRGVRALQGLAQTYAADGNLPALIVALRAWVALEPRNALALYNLGFADYQSRNFGPAERLLLRALKLNDRLADAHNTLGEIYYQRRELDKAQAQWKATLAIDPENQAAQRGLLEWRKIAAGKRNLLTADSSPLATVC